MPDSFEIFLNENTADLQVFRITLAALLLRLVGADPPTAKAKMQDLKNSVMGTTQPMSDPTAASDIGRPSRIKSCRGFAH